MNLIFGWGDLFQRRDMKLDNTLKKILSNRLSGKRGLVNNPMIFSFETQQNKSQSAYQKDYLRKKSQNSLVKTHDFLLEYFKDLIIIVVNIFFVKTIE